MSAPSTRTPPERPRREAADSLQMSLAEKLACEREARHDVAARGRIADAAPVQHYLTHARCEDRRSPSTRTGHREGHGGHPTADSGAISPVLRSWLRWGEDGGPGRPSGHRA